MDNVTLKKKLSTFVSDKGYLKNLSDDVLYEVLVSWENWPGTSKEFYRSIGFSARQMASVVGKAKKLKREGHYGEGDFKPVHVPVSVGARAGDHPGIEVTWSNGQLIRFSYVDQLLDFLKKCA